MKKEKDTDLEKIAMYRPQGKRCITCKSPYLDLIRRFRAAGESFSTISNFLAAERDYEINVDVMRRHFSTHEKATRRSG